jgi:hypothetical protein
MNAPQQGQGPKPSGPPLVVAQTGGLASHAFIIDRSIPSMSIAQTAYAWQADSRDPDNTAQGLW